MQRSGVPDLLVSCKGHFVGVELKAPNGKPSEIQIWNLLKIDDSGGFGWVLYPDGFEDFKTFVGLLEQNRTLDAWRLYNQKKGWEEV